MARLASLRLSLAALLVLAAAITVFCCTPSSAESAPAADDELALGSSSMEWATMVDSMEDAREAMLLEVATRAELESMVEAGAEAGADAEVDADAEIEADMEVEAETETDAAPKRAAAKAKKPAAAKTRAAPKAAAAKPAAARLTPAEHKAKWDAFKAANPGKKYASVAAETAAFNAFTANRAKIVSNNDKFATKLNPKPFKSAGSLADIPAAQFKAQFLKTRRGNSRGKKLPSRLPQPKLRKNPNAKAASGKIATKKAAASKKPAAAAKRPAAKAAKRTRFMQVDAEATPKSKPKPKQPKPQKPKGRIAGTAGGGAGSAGNAAGSAGGGAGSAGGAAGVVGGGAGSAGGAAGVVGGGAGSAGGAAGGVGGGAGSAGGAAGQLRGNVVYQPTAAQYASAVKFAPLTGSPFNNPLDKTPEDRICRTVATIWFKRYGETLSQSMDKAVGNAVRSNYGRKKSVGPTPAESIAIRERFSKSLCTVQSDLDDRTSTSDLLRTTFNELKGHPQNTPFMNSFVSTNDFVRSQFGCGSCWATAAVGSLEAALKKAGKYTAPLSVQQIIDCVRTKESTGCAGGTPQDALEYLTKTPAALASVYQLTKGEGKCIVQTTGPKSAGWAFATETCMTGSCVDQFKYEIDLLFQVKADGPFIAYVDANAWQNYGGGIFPHERCSSAAVAGNHVVQLLGYGQQDGVPYWIAKNSWGPQWGEKGYIRLAMGVNACGIANFVGRATV